MSEIDTIRIIYSIASNGYDYITRGLNAGKESDESKKVKLEKEIEEREKVTPSYDVRGSLVNLLV